MKKMVIVYYTWSHGNTERIAEMLQRETGADLIRIETVKPYEGSYDEVVAEGQREVQEGYLPEIVPVKNLSSYDAVAVGTPTWWYTMAPAMASFLKKTDLSGKTVIPFMTNGGWPGHVINDMKKMCKGAQIVCTKEVRFDSDGGDILKTEQSEIDAWIQDVKKVFNTTEVL